MPAAGIEHVSEPRTAGPSIGCLETLMIVQSWFWRYHANAVLTMLTKYDWLDECPMDSAKIPENMQRPLDIKVKNELLLRTTVMLIVLDFGD